MISVEGEGEGKCRGITATLGKGCRRPPVASPQSALAADGRDFRTHQGSEESLTADPSSLIAPATSRPATAKGGFSPCSKTEFFARGCDPASRLCPVRPSGGHRGARGRLRGSRDRENPERITGRSTGLKMASRHLRSRGTSEGVRLLHSCRE